MGNEMNSSTSSPKHGYGFDLLYFKRFWTLQKFLFPQFFCDTLGLFVLLLVVAGLEQFLVFKVGLIPGQFYEVLGNKDLDSFTSAIIQSLMVIGSMTLIKSSRMFVTNSLIVAWRRKLTRALHKDYFSGIKYYLLNVFNKQNLDNPDQRLTADVDVLCQSYGTIIADIVVAPFTIGYYTYSAFSRAGWIGPVSMFGFFIVSSILNKFLMSPIVRITVQREKMEGNFRFRHAIVRSKAESLAFLGSEAVLAELNEANKKLNSLCLIQQNLFNRQFILNLATNGFEYFGSIASYLVISVPIFAGNYDNLSQPELSRTISENAFVCMYLIYWFSQLVRLATQVSTMAGVTHRVAETFEILDKLPSEQEKCPEEFEDIFEDASNRLVTSNQPVVPVNSSIIQVDEEQILREQVPVDFIFKIVNLDLKIPNEETVLIRGLNLEISSGKNLLIMGNSSTGKSSLLRVLRGLWPIPEGAKIIRGSESMFFIPQKMFLSEDCTLRAQVIYPKQKEGPNTNDDTFILQLLHDLGLSHLLERCGGGLDSVPPFHWSDELSPGELQRLCFARLFYHRPQVAILDEATSALSTDVEEIIYQRCLETGIILISVGHRENLRKYHDLLLQLGLPDGQWKLTELR